MEGQPPTGPWADPWDPSSGGAYRSPPPSSGSPFPPAGYPAQPAMEQPRTIRVAVVLMFVGAALSLLGIFASFTGSEQMAEMYDEISPGLSSEQVDDMVSQNQASGAVGGLVAVGLWIWMAVVNGQGKTWARITGTVLGGIHIASILIMVPISAALFPVPALSLVLSIGTATLAVVIIILMYQRDASAYYETMSRRPYPPYGGYRPY